MWAARAVHNCAVRAAGSRKLVLRLPHLDVCFRHPEVITGADMGTRTYTKQKSSSKRNYGISFN